MSFVTNLFWRPTLASVTLAATLLSGCVTLSEPMVEPSPIPPSPTTFAARVAETTPTRRAARSSATRAATTAASSATPAVVAATATPTLYTVVAGDILGTIAVKFDVAVADLMAANGLTDADTLSIGQQLLIPATGQPAPVAAAPAPATASATGTPLPMPVTDGGHILHYVRVGETISAIATQYNVARDDILRANGFRPDVQLTAGDPILIPQGAYTPVPTSTPPGATPVPTIAIAFGPSATPEPARPTVAATATPSTYTVQAGDLAGTIARDRGITVEALAAANPGVNMDSLSIGQVLLLPTPATDSANVPPSVTPTSVTLQPTATATAIPPIMATHVVRQGETFTTIARWYGIGEEILKGHNPDVQGEPEADTVLQIPLGTPTPTATPTSAPTLTPTPAPEFLAPTLLLPSDGSLWVYQEDEAPLQLLWTSTGILDDDEFYVVRLRALDEAGDVLWVESHWAQTPSWRVERELLEQVEGRVVLRWDVMVMRRTSPASAEPWTGEPLSEKSETFEIIFHNPAD